MMDNPINGVNGKAIPKLLEAPPQDSKAEPAISVESSKLNGTDVELLCPSCRTPLQAFWGRKRARFTIYHSTRSCPHRFDTFGADEDEQKAWAIARKTIEELNSEQNGPNLR